MTHDVGHRTDSAQRIDPGIVNSGILLQHDTDRSTGMKRMLDSGDRLHPTDGNRHQDMRKQHHIAHGHQRNHMIGQFESGYGKLFHGNSLGKKISSWISYRSSVTDRSAWLCALAANNVLKDSSVKYCFEDMDFAILQSV